MTSGFIAEMVAAAQSGVDTGFLGEWIAAMNAQGTIAQSQVTGLQTALAALAPKANPTFTGTLHSAAQAVAGDATFDLNTHGPVLVDQSDGHTYRLIVTAGVLGVVQVS